MLPNIFACPVIAIARPDLQIRIEYVHYYLVVAGVLLIRRTIGEQVLAMQFLAQLENSAPEIFLCIESVLPAASVGRIDLQRVRNGKSLRGVVDVLDQRHPVADGLLRLDARRLDISYSQIEGSR